MTGPVIIDSRETVDFGIPLPRVDFAQALGPCAILDVFVAGRPVSKGSLKAWCTRGRSHHVSMKEETAGSKEWRVLINRTIRMVGGLTESETGPVRVELEFYVERQHDKHGKVWPSHDTDFPTAISIGDIDKFTRNVLDAMTDAEVYKDDSQVASVIATKCWAENTIDGAPRPGVQITVWRM